MPTGLQAHQGGGWKHIRSLNRDYFRDRTRVLSREAFDRLPEARLAGPMFDQTSAARLQRQHTD